jgi:hypothetical protein
VVKQAKCAEAWALYSFAATEVYLSVEAKRTHTGRLPDLEANKTLHCQKIFLPDMYHFDPDGF